MANYKNIHGLNIPIRSSDPANPQVGELWYNSTSNTLKGQLNNPAGVWSTGGATIKTSNFAMSGGTQNAAFMAGGAMNPPYQNDGALTYNGTSWTVQSNLPTGKYNGAAAGTDSAGLIFAGAATYGDREATITWDGSTWTSANTYPSIGPAPPVPGGAGGTQSSSGTGTADAALSVGGRGDPPPVKTTRVLDYNGTSWSDSGNDTPVGNSGSMMDGPNTAAWKAGGAGGPSGDTIFYDGSTWTSGNALNYAMPQGIQCQGWGPNSNAVAAGGTSSYPTSNQTQTFDGTSWSAGTTLSQSRQNGAMTTQMAGTGDTGFVTGGYTDPPVGTHTNKTEEYNGPGPATVTLSSS
jgi:hypothetical protein